MKLRQVWKNGSAALAIETEAGLVDVLAEAARREIAAPATMLEAIEGGEQAPSLLLLILAIVVLGGGAVFIAIVTIQKLKQLKDAERARLDEEDALLAAQEEAGEEDEEEEACEEEPDEEAPEEE